NDVGALRQSEVDALAKVYRDRLHQPERAQALYRAWLDDQRNRRLSPRDAEGRIALAEQYENLLDDRTTAVALLRAAWSIDPQSREVADAFRSRGFRKLNGAWVEPGKSSTVAAPPAQPGLADDGKGGAAAVEIERAVVEVPAPGRKDSLLNATPEQVVD